ncbi:MAG TPA: hypothetical protein VG501_05845 [Rhizomicrobium sp.]|nr:hypothetical protein [Rhizomicrobium sp.]
MNLVIAAEAQPITKPNETSLVEARLTDVQDISSHPESPRISCDATEAICLDGSWRMTFSILRTIWGPPASGKLYYDQASSQPIKNLDYLLVISHEGGSQTIRWMTLSKEGLCLNERDADALGIAGALKSTPCFTH